jgi:hypothetical protein
MRFSLASLFAAALIAWPGRWRRTLGMGLVVALAYLPWLAYTLPPLLARVGERTGEAGFSLAPVAGVMLEGLHGALFVGPPPAWAMPAVVAVLVLGSLVARPSLWRRLAVVVLPTAAVLSGAALGAQAHM